MVKDSPIGSGKATMSATIHSSNVIVPTLISPRKPTVKPTILDPAATYTGEQVDAFLAEAQKMPLLRKTKANSEGWIEHKLKKTVKKERKLENKFSKKRKFNSPLTSTEG